MHCIPMSIHYNLNLSGEELREILRAGKDWGFTPQKTIECIVREWSIVRIDQAKEDRRLLSALTKEKEQRDR